MIVATIAAQRVQNIWVRLKASSRSDLHLSFHASHSWAKPIVTFGSTPMAIAPA